MPDARDHLRQLHTLAHYLKRRDDWTWKKQLWGEVIGLEHPRMRLTIEVDHIAFWAIDSALNAAGRKRR